MALLHTCLGISCAPQFLVLIPLTLILDLYAILFRSLSILAWVVTLLLALLKAPLFFSCLAQLRERGGELNFEGWTGIGGLNRLGGQNCEPLNGIMSKF